MAYERKSRDQMIEELPEDVRETIFTPEDVAKHNTWSMDDDGKKDLWLIIDGFVVDATEYADSHPGGPDKLIEFAGKDGTEA